MGAKFDNLWYQTRASMIKGGQLKNNTTTFEVRPVTVRRFRFPDEGHSPIKLHKQIMQRLIMQVRTCADVVSSTASSYNWQQMLQTLEHYCLTDVSHTTPESKPRHGQ